MLESVFVNGRDYEALKRVSWGGYEVSIPGEISRCYTLIVPENRDSGEVPTFLEVT